MLDEDLIGGGGRGWILLHNQCMLTTLNLYTNLLHELKLKGTVGKASETHVKPSVHPPNEIILGSYATSLSTVSSSYKVGMPLIFLEGCLKDNNHKSKHCFSGHHLVDSQETVVSILSSIMAANAGRETMFLVQMQSPNTPSGPISSHLSGSTHQSLFLGWGFGEEARYLIT